MNKKNGIAIIANLLFSASLTVVGSLAVITMLAFSSSAQAATSWDFRGLADAPIGQIAPSGSFPNALTFAVDGHTVTASAWVEVERWSARMLEGSAVNREWTGLGSCTAAEGGGGACDGSTQQVDNQDEQEWILLVFDDQFNFDSLIHSPFGYADRDASYWIGDINPNQNLDGLTYGDLAVIGFGNRIGTSASFGEGTVTINFGGATGNAILIGARLGQTNDRMKIASLQASVVPVPAAVWLFGSALGLLGWRRRKVST